MGKGPQPDQWTHNRNCYVNHRCRCPVCKEDYGRYRREWKRRRPAPTEAARASGPPLPAPTRYPDHYATWPELVAAELWRREVEPR